MWCTILTENQTCTKSDAAIGLQVGMCVCNCMVFRRKEITFRSAKGGRLQESYYIDVAICYLFSKHCGDFLILF